MKQKTPEEMLERMAALCARSEQCEYDIRQKLFKAQIAPGEADRIIARLREGRFIDDVRFARSFASYKVRFSAWGRYKIRMALAAKRIPAAAISEALEAIDPTDYRDACRRAARAKARGLDLTSRDDRLKLFRHLQSRGFESDIIRSSLISHS